MKKIFSLVVAMVLAIGATVSAQSIQGELVLGLNIADVDASGASSRVGFNAGVRGTYAFQSQRKGVYANGAMLLSLKGMKVEKYTFNPFYLEIPVHIGYKYPITRSVAIFGEFGPYFGIGLFGTVEGEDVFCEDGYNRFDVGLGLRTGKVERFNRLRLRLGRCHRRSFGKEHKRNTLNRLQILKHRINIHKKSLHCEAFFV